MSYDAKCFDLAEIFLSDNPEIDTGNRKQELAQHIQDEIDSWISTWIDQKKKGQHEPA